MQPETTPFCSADHRSHFAEAVAARVSRVVVYSDPVDAFAAWDSLETVAPASPYQTRRWLLPWLATTGRSTGVTPFIVVAFDEAGDPMALLPFGVWKQGMRTVAGFLGGRDSNFNLGLFRPGLTWTAAAVLALLRRAARLAPRRIGLFILHNQPAQWDGVLNPLLCLPHQPSPSFGYKATLKGDAELFIRQALSADTRKKLRKKKQRLDAVGLLRHDIAETAEMGREILDALIEQRMSRCKMLGLGISDLPTLRDFLERSSIVTMADPAVELHALRCGETILATFAGTSHRGRYCGMVISFDAVSDLSRFSPGEILLESLVRSKCREGIAVFDLGVGEGRYKQAFCSEAESLFDSLIPVSAWSIAFAVAERAKLRLKRAIKQNRWAWVAITAVRKLLAKARHDGRAEESR